MDFESLVSEFGIYLKNELGGALSFESNRIILENATISLDKFNNPRLVIHKLRVDFLKEQGYYRPEGAVEFFFRKANFKDAFFLVTFSFIETSASKQARSSDQVSLAIGELLASITKC